MVSLRQTNSSESPSGPSLASQSYATSNPGQPLPIGAATAPPPTPDTQRPLLRIARATHSDGVALAATQPITIATPLVQSATATLPHGLVPVSDLPHQIRQHATPGRPTSLELFMAPEELGKLRIFMTPDGDKIRIVIQAERPETMELLRRNSDSFSADLRQSGFGGASFSFGGWGDPPPNQTAQPQDASTTTFISASEHPHAPIKQSKPNSSSGLDLRV
nr:flagellar hook-length control protein FliK [Pseudorhodobacter ferrugineus]